METPPNQDSFLTKLGRIFTPVDEKYKQEGVLQSEKSFWIVAVTGLVVATIGGAALASAADAGILGTALSGAAGLTIGTVGGILSMATKKNKFLLGAKSIFDAATTKLDHIRGIEPEIDPGLRVRREQEAEIEDARAATLSDSPEQTQPSPDAPGIVDSVEESREPQAETPEKTISK